MAPQLSPQQRQLIMSYYTIKEIERQTEITRTTINFWLRGNEETGGDLSAHTNQPFLNTKVTATQYSVSTETIRRRLLAAGFKTRIPPKNVVFSRAHTQARVSFAWKNNVVIFADEKTFKSHQDGHKILKRKNYERYLVQNLTSLPNRSSGRLRMGFWGWMSSVSPVELVEISDRLNAIFLCQYFKRCNGADCAIAPSDKPHIFARTTVSYIVLGLFRHPSHTMAC